MGEVTILKIGKNLLVPIQVELHDRSAMQLQEDIISSVEKTGASGLLIDVSKLQVVDSFLGRLIGDTAAMARVMGAETVVTGLQPEVAITFMELGMHLSGIHTALNTEAGLEFLLQMGDRKVATDIVPDGDAKSGST